MTTWQVIQGDCLDVLRTLPDASVDAVVTDPPYGLSFMGKKWDYDVPSVGVWAECLRVLKPGGHLLAFAGTRTQHRMAVRIEDAGFEIRDMIAWVYGSGFPKSKNVALSIDKGEGHPNRGRAIPTASTFQACDVEQRNKLTSNPVPAYEGKTEAARQWSGWGTALKPAWESVTLATKPMTDDAELAIILSSLSRLEDQLCQLSSASAVSPTSGSSQSASVEACGTAQCSAGEPTNTPDGLPDQTGTLRCELAIRTSLNIVRSWRRTLDECLQPTSTSTIATESKTTIDWRTLRFSLSQITPAIIIRASSHPDGFSASADTAVAHFNASLALLQATRTLSAIGPAMSLGAAAFPDVDVQPNLDPCIMARKPFASTVAANVQEFGTGAINVDGCRVGTEPVPINRLEKWSGFGQEVRPEYMQSVNTSGRWPANLIHDGSDEVVGAFPRAGGSVAGSFQREKTSRGLPGGGYGQERADMREKTDIPKPGYGDSGSAARFFYCAKASKADRGDDNNHPTVKPTDLMRYLCRLVTPPGGTVLDPFTGSGSTGRGAVAEAFNFIGIEREAEYVEIARRRIAEAANHLYAEAK